MKVTHEPEFNNEIIKSGYCVFRTREKTESVQLVRRSYEDHGVFQCASRHITTRTRLSSWFFLVYFSLLYLGKKSTKSFILVYFSLLYLGKKSTKSIILVYFSLL
jgi:hypothetical protein